jgi:hypothetical protein
MKRLYTISLYTMWFQLYNILEKVLQWTQEKKSGVTKDSGSRREGIKGKAHRILSETSLSNAIWYYCGGYMLLYFC